MGIENTDKPVSVATSHIIREQGQRLATEITQSVHRTINSGILTPVEAWIILVGTMRSVGEQMGLPIPSQLEQVRRLYDAAEKQRQAGLVSL